jgi:hypothetical protein
MYIHTLPVSIEFRAKNKVDPLPDLICYYSSTVIVGFPLPPPQHDPMTRTTTMGTLTLSMCFYAHIRMSVQNWPLRPPLRSREGAVV